MMDSKLDLVLDGELGSLLVHERVLMLDWA